MATATLKKTRRSWKTMADLLERLGGIPPERVWLDPLPGTAKEKDVIAAWSGVDKRLCELVQGTLVEKPMGTKEAMLAGFILYLLWDYLETNDIGLPVGADGAFRLKLGLVRIPDVSFISWDRLPEGEMPGEPIARRIPELAVEVVSESNTPREIAAKIVDFFDAGVKLVWVIYPKTQTAEEYTSPTAVKHVTKTQSLDGHNVLPGFSLSLKQLFTRTKRRGKPR